MTECAANCLRCTTAGATVCDVNSCVSGYTYVSTTQTCQACPPNCFSCAYDATSGQTICNTGGCNSGFGLKLSTKTCSGKRSLIALWITL